MGWDCLSSKPSNVKQYLDREFAKGLVASAMVGTQYYAAYRSKKTGEVFAVVVITRTQGGEWGYKVMDESVEPYYYNCPAKILKLLTPTDQPHANEWRQKCVQASVRKTLAKSLKNGDVIKFDDQLSFGKYGTEDTFIVCNYAIANKKPRIRFRMNGTKILCRITNWRDRPFTLLHKTI